jgi:hypothetical protein
MENNYVSIQVPGPAEVAVEGTLYVSGVESEPLTFTYTYVDPVAERFAALEARIAELEARLDPAALLQVLTDQARGRGA